MKDFQFKLNNGSVYRTNNPKMLLLIPILLEENKQKAISYLKNKTVLFDKNNKDILNVLDTIEEITNMATDSVAFAYDLGSGAAHTVHYWEKHITRIKTIN